MPVVAFPEPVLTRGGGLMLGSLLLVAKRENGLSSGATTVGAQKG